jgi:hypothetical protein
VNWLERSDELHARVRAFAGADPEQRESFDELALDIARYQLDHSSGFRALVEGRGDSLDRTEDIPALPSDAFRLTRVAVYPPELDEVRFFTSGTTGLPGIHVMRTTQTYRELSRRSGEAALLGRWAGPRVVVAIAPAPGPRQSSSLGFMMRSFMQAFDGRAVALDPAGASFDPDAPGRWLLGPAGVDVAGLRRAALIATQRQEPLLVLATSLALAMLLDALGDAKLPAPKKTVVMQTGGFKGRRSDVSPERLRAGVAKAFRIPKEQVIGEYGMTELTSQLYESPSPSPSGQPGAASVYVPPPWLRVSAVDPVTLRPVRDGDVGLARFVDLGNIDSAIAVVTQDLVRRTRAGVELVGRRAGSPLRGCSLGAEELVRRSAARGVGGCA